MTRPYHFIRALPALLRPYRRIFLLSHMRAYTSLFGHILGSHPDIEGYYELQMGYHSWRSLLRQKLHYFYYHGHTPKHRAHYLLDKILHNDHRIDPSILARSRDTYIFCLRPPGETVPSIIDLYQRVSPEHQWATEEGAFAYYLDRLEGLKDLSRRLHGRYLFMDAECLTINTSEALSFLTETLYLTTPLEPEYLNGPMTAKPSRGDPSGRIGCGHIVTAPSPKSPLNDEQPLSEATNHYAKARDILISRSRYSCLID
ncbi:MULTISPECIES: hypothetical protein [Halorhodospira]|uniref:hypothetical protein n=1 Tax=Halorhodospira TaxID=85108 RepID=UPI001EE87675|nr:MULTISPECIES: hypothetical protein [Halorhodospira]MCG5528007.1 hypothetical protein [Halorhodospira halophila]MCG5542123.1 hypothetical protein [Halorhodospira sp. 9628]